MTNELRQKLIVDASLVMTSSIIASASAAKVAGSRRHTRATTARIRTYLRPVAATTMTIIPVVVIIVVAALLVMIVTAIVDRPQEVIEGLRRDASPLPPRRRVREAEMNPQVNASLDHVVGQI